MMRDFIRSSGSIFIADMGAKVLGFVLISALTFALSPGDLGRYNALVTAAASLCAMSGWGVPIVLQRQSALVYKNHLELSKSLTAGLSLMVILIVLILATIVLPGTSSWTWLFEDVDSSLTYWVPVITLGYFCIQSPLSILLGLGSFRIYSLRALLEACVTALLVSVGAFYLGLQGALVGLFTSLILNSVFVVFVMRGIFNEKDLFLHFPIERRRITGILRDGSPYFIGNTLIGAIANFVMIGLFAQHIGYTDFGFLRVALSLVAILAVIPNAIKTVTITFVARLGESSLRLRSLQMRYLFFAILTSTALLALVLKPVISLLFGDEYIAGLQVYTFMLYIHVAFNIHQVLNTFIVGDGKFRYSGLVSGILSLLYIGMMCWLIPAVGMIGYYIAFGVSFLAGGAVLAISELSNKNYKDRKRIVASLIITIGFLVGALCINIVGKQELTRYVAQAFWLILYIVINITWLFASDERKAVLLWLRLRGSWL